MRIFKKASVTFAGFAIAALALSGCAAQSTTPAETSGSTGGSTSGSTEPASTYPDRPITFMAPYNPGGSVDPVAREFTAQLVAELGTTGVVQNIPGGDETIGLTFVFNSPADGYTIGLSSATGIIVQPLINDALGFKGVDDYTPIVKVVEAPNAIFVRADSPYQTLDDLIADAKARPGQIRIGTTGRLTNNSFTILALEQQAGIDLTLVPFSGGAGEATRAAIAGEIEGVVPTAAGQLGFVASGDIRALAHTGADAYTAVLPGSVALNSAGYSVPFSSDYVIVGPKGMPADVEARLIEAAYKVATSQAWADWCAEKGFLADARQGQDLLDWIALATEASVEAIALADAEG
jgi:putative tricarboxylic transport membrane protein